ncbi:MAG: MTH1187 family thiamine-binding protein [Actinocatenispora sp.]
MSVLVAFSVAPSGTGESVAEDVAAAVRVVRESGLRNRTDAMFTTIEGDSWDEVMDVVKRATEAVQARSSRVSLVLKADLRAGVSGAIDSKVERVEQQLAGE